MEATSDYWKAPFFRLEAEGSTATCWTPGRSRRCPAGRRRIEPTACGWPRSPSGAWSRALSAPPQQIRRLRTLTRYRRHLTEERSREKQRAEKLLEDALLKLSVAVSDLHGVSARQIMEALIGGCRDPKALAQLARGRRRVKVSALEQALDGRARSPITTRSCSR